MANERRFDAVVIGTGVAGQTAASELAVAGRSVAVVDRREYGGTCALRGCEPKKVLVEAATAIETARALEGRGVTGAASLDWSELMAFKRTFTDSKPTAVESWLSGEGIATLHGEARFLAIDTLEVAGERIVAGDVVIATGAHPLDLGIPGAELVWDSEEFLSAEVLPERIAFIGGGFISFEFAHIAATAGASVTILHRSDRVLREFDPALAGLLADSYRAAGIAVRTNAPVTEVRRAPAGSMQVVCGDGYVLACDAVVHGAGRVPDLARLDLEAAGVGYSRHGVDVDEHLCARGVEHVYAAGDAAALGPALTPVAMAQARVAVANILSPGSAAYAPSVTPAVCFSHPVLAAVGMSEQEAADSGADVDVRFSEMTAWASSRRTGEPVAAAKVLVDRGSGRILGAHLLGRHAGDIVNLFALAISAGVTVRELKAALWAYPTASSEIAYLL